MSRDLLLALLSLALVAVAVAAAVPSFRKAERPRGSLLVTLGDPLATGIFLGAGLIHMLPDAARGYAAHGVGFPWPFAICGATVLALAALEQAGSDRASTAAPPLVAAAALAVHSFLAGAALGATPGETAMLVLFLALVAHKGAASFSLAQLLARSSLARSSRLAVQGAFVAALPIGVALGQVATHQQQDWPLAVPTIMALGAGTFLHFGTPRRARPDRTGTLAGLAPWCGYLLMAGIAVIG